MRTFSLAAFSMSLTCFSTIAFLMATSPASGPLTFWAWIRPQRTTLGMRGSLREMRGIIMPLGLAEGGTPSEDPREPLLQAQRRVAALVVEPRVVGVRALVQ